MKNFNLIIGKEVEGEIGKCGITEVREFNYISRACSVLLKIFFAGFNWPHDRK